MKSSANPEPKAIRLSRLFRWRVFLFVAALIVINATVLGAVLYVTASQELGKSFFSAHRDLYLITQRLLPVIAAVSAGLAILMTLIAWAGLRILRLSLERSGRDLMHALKKVEEGNLTPVPESTGSQHLAPLTAEAATAVESLRSHLVEVRGEAEELHRAVMRLNYHAFEQGNITLAELKDLADNLNTLSRELSHSLKWFEL